VTNKKDHLLTPQKNCWLIIIAYQPAEGNAINSTPGKNTEAQHYLPHYRKISLNTHD
jgi:hypothetical protein